MKAIERKGVNDFALTAAEQRRVDRSNIISEYEKLVKQSIADALALIKDNKSVDSRSRKSASIYSKASRNIKATNDSPYEPADADAPHVSFKKPNSRPPSAASNKQQNGRNINKQSSDEFKNTNRQNSSSDKFENNGNDKLENMSSNSSPEKSTKKNCLSNSSSGTGGRKPQQPFYDNDSVSSGIFDSAGEYDNKKQDNKSPQKSRKNQQPELVRQKEIPKKSESLEDDSDDDQLGVFANDNVSDDEEYEVELNTDTRKAEIEKNKKGRLIY